MTRDELADAFAANFAELHSQIDALEDGPDKIVLGHLADAAHGLMDRLRQRAKDSEMIEPFSGGGDKEPPGGG